MSYTQDESYYILDTGEDSFVYLGLKENINPDEMIKDLEAAQNDNIILMQNSMYRNGMFINMIMYPYLQEQYIVRGANTVVLEISATPTFSRSSYGIGGAWDLMVNHVQYLWNTVKCNTMGSYNIMDKENILNLTESVSDGDGWREERTGLDALSFIETRRHWFTKR